MKKAIVRMSVLALVVLFMAGILAGCGSKKEEPKPAEQKQATEQKPAEQKQAEKPKDAYPNKPVTVIVPFPPGGSNDTTTRAIAPALQQQLGVPVVVQNMEGSSGTIGRNFVYQAAPDGYTLMAGSSTYPLHSALYQNIAAYKGDFVDAFIPVGSWLNEDGNGIAVNLGSPLNTWDDLVAEANKRQMTVGIGGSIGSSDHLTALMINKNYNINLKIVPYSTGGDMATALKGKHVDVAILSMGGVDADPSQMKFLASTLAKRIPLIQNVPTFKEMGKQELDIGYKVGLFAPLKTSPEIIKTLDAALGKAFYSDTYQDWAKKTKKPVGEYYNTEKWTSFMRNFSEQMKKILPIVEEDMKRIQGTKK